MTSGTVQVGPARQMVTPGHNATVYISNPGDVAVAVDLENTEDLVVHDKHFTLRPHTQQDVTFYVDPQQDGCSYYAPTFYVHPKTDQTVTARGGVSTELLIRGVHGTEAECVAAIPGVGSPVAPHATPGWEYGVLGLPVLAFVVVALVTRRRKPAKPKPRPSRASGFA